MLEPIRINVITETNNIMKSGVLAMALLSVCLPMTCSHQDHLNNRHNRHLYLCVHTMGGPVHRGDFLKPHPLLMISICLQHQMLNMGRDLLCDHHPKMFHLWHCRSQITWKTQGKVLRVHSPAARLSGMLSASVLGPTYQCQRTHVCLLVYTHKSLADLFHPWCKAWLFLGGGGYRKWHMWSVGKKPWKINLGKPVPYYI